MRLVSMLRTVFFGPRIKSHAFSFAPLESAAHPVGLVRPSFCWSPRAPAFQAIIADDYVMSVI